MTDKPQTLAEQIRALEPPRGFGPASIMREGWNAAIIAAAAQADYAASITAAIADAAATPALGWKAMQTAAAEAVAKEAHGETVLGGQRFKTVKLEDAVEAILALPGPTDAQLLAEAVKLPEVQELVKASKWVGFAAQTSGGTAGRDLALIAAIDVLAAALAKISGAA